MQPLPPIDPAAPSRRSPLAAIGTALLLSTSFAGAVEARGTADDGIRYAEGPAPLRGEAAYQAGRGLLAAGDVTGAMAQFRAALVDLPESVDALNGLAVCYDRMGRFDLSRNFYEAALAVAPDAALVLNNLGYSLFLQKDYGAAIPILQRAAASTDTVAAAASRKLLALAAARLREAVIAEESRIARAEIAAPQARVEMTARGEQRLVIGAPATAVAAAAAAAADLGDAAALIEVAPAWTEADDRRIAAEVTAAESRERAAAAPLAAVAPPLAAVAPPAPVAAAAARVRDAQLQAQAAPVRREAMAAARRPRATRPAGRREAELVAFMALAEAPRPGLLAPRPPELAGHEPHADPRPAVFESDDPVLNAFATRMRALAAAAA